MLDQEQTEAVLRMQRPDQFHELMALGTGQARRRLIKQQQRWIGDETAREVDPLLHAIGQVAGRVLRVVGDLQGFERGHAAGLDIRFEAAMPRQAQEDRRRRWRPRAQMRAQHHILDHAHGMEQAQGLKGACHAAAGDLIGPQADDGSAANAHIAAAGPIQAGDDIERCGFSRAVRADQAADLAGIDPQREVLERLYAAEN
jgi:hypothetical protein